MPISEKETRKNLFNYARRIGAEKDLQNLMNKWDRMIALASSKERDDMCRLAILEVQSLLDIYAEAGLTINNEIIIPVKLK